MQQISGSTARAAVIGSPPSGKNLQECVTRVGKPSDCVTVLTEDWKSLRAAENKVATEMKTTYVDTASWFCNSVGACPGFVGSTPTRVDWTHHG
jgi:hypothetical protein